MFDYKKMTFYKKLKAWSRITSPLILLVRKTERENKKYREVHIFETYYNCFKEHFDKYSYNKSKPLDQNNPEEDELRKITCGVYRWLKDNNYYHDWDFYYFHGQNFNLHRISSHLLPIINFIKYVKYAWKYRYYDTAL